MSNRCQCGALWRTNKKKGKPIVVFEREHADNCKFKQKEKFRQK